MRRKEKETHLIRINIRTIRIHIRVIPDKRSVRYPSVVRDRGTCLAGEDDVGCCAVFAGDAEAEGLESV